MVKFALPPQRAAIVVIECQNDLIDASNIGVAHISGVLAEAVRQRALTTSIAAVLAAARTAGVPVLYANKESNPTAPVTNARIFRVAKGAHLLQPGSWGAAVHDDLRPQAQDLVLTRTQGIDPSADANLFAALRRAGRDLIVAVGVSTNFAVEGLVRGAVNHAFEVVVVEDCCAGVSVELHDFSMRHILPLLATISSSAEVVAALTRRE